MGASEACFRHAMEMAPGVPHHLESFLAPLALQYFSDLGVDYFNLSFVESSGHRSSLRFIKLTPFVAQLLKRFGREETKQRCTNYSQKDTGKTRLKPIVPEGEQSPDREAERGHAITA